MLLRLTRPSVTNDMRNHKCDGGRSRWTDPRDTQASQQTQTFAAATLRRTDVVVSNAPSLPPDSATKADIHYEGAMSAQILALVGSLRSGSDNRRLAEAAVKLAPSGISVEIFEGLADVVLYNEDIDQAGAVAAVDRLRAKVQSADALLLVTPEYNGTMSAALKNAIDWISRPFGAGVITGKPTAVIGTSHGHYGGVWAHDDARKSARIAGATVLDDVALSVPAAHTRFARIHPVDDVEIAATMPGILTALAAAAPSRNSRGNDD
jgi:NAD(P)H-dependent FMN reductase